MEYNYSGDELEVVALLHFISRYGCWQWEWRMCKPEMDSMKLFQSWDLPHSFVVINLVINLAVLPKLILPWNGKINDVSTFGFMLQCVCCCISLCVPHIPPHWFGPVYCKRITNIPPALCTSTGNSIRHMHQIYNLIHDIIIGLRGKVDWPTNVEFTPTPSPNLGILLKCVSGAVENVFNQFFDLLFTGYPETSLHFGLVYFSALQ